MNLWPLALLLLAQETSIPAAKPPVAAVADSSNVITSNDVPARFHVLTDASLGWGSSLVLLGGEAESGPVVTAGLTGGFERGSFRFGVRLRFLTADLKTNSRYYQASTKMYAGALCGMGQQGGLWAEGCFGARRHEWKHEHSSGTENTPDMVLGGGYDLYLIPAIALRGTVEISTAVLEWMAYASIGLVVRI